VFYCELHKEIQLHVTKLMLYRSLEHQNLLGNRAAHRSLEAVSATLSSTASVIDKFPKRLDEIQVNTHATSHTVSQLRNDFSARLHDLSSGIDAVLQSKLAAFTTIVSETLLKVGEVRHTTQQTRYAIENIKASSEAIECLPTGMPQIVKKTFRDVLTDFYLEKRLASQDQEPSAQIPMNDNYPSNANQASRRVVRQIATTSTYIRDIGIVTVQSISTTFREYGSSIPRISTVTQTDLLLNPHPEFLRMGVWCSFIQQGFTTFQPPPEPKLRVFNVIEPSAEIVKACIAGDLPRARWLFAAGLASPFDRVWGEIPLLEFIMIRIISTVKTKIKDRISPHHLPKLIAIFRELVGHGLDPGIPSSNIDMFGRSPLAPLAPLASDYPQDSECLVDLARVIVKYSTQDPFSDLNLDEFVWRGKFAGIQIPIYSFLSRQEDWQVTWAADDKLRQKFDNAIFEAFISRGNGGTSTCYFGEHMEEILRFGSNPLVIVPPENHYSLNVDYFKILEQIIDRYKEEGERKALYPEHRWTRLRARLGEAVAACIGFCKEEITSAPYTMHRFLGILKKFKFIGEFWTMHSALSAHDLLDFPKVKNLLEVLEEESYASLAYQLFALSCNSETLPRELEYSPTASRLYLKGRSRKVRYDGVQHLPLPRSEFNIEVTPPKVNHVSKGNLLRQEQEQPNGQKAKEIADHLHKLLKGGAEFPWAGEYYCLEYWLSERPDEIAQSPKHDGQGIDTVSSPTEELADDAKTDREKLADPLPSLNSTSSNQEGRASINPDPDIVPTHIRISHERRPSVYGGIADSRTHDAKVDEIISAMNNF
jgi:hypothetical protein